MMHNINHFITLILLYTVYPGLQCFVLRPVEHPLNYRRAPTIQISSSASQQDRHLYGENRLVTL